MAPEPGRFETLRAKTAALVHDFAGWSDDQARSITAPVLVLIGDTDFILVPDAAESAELLPGGQLAVLAATTHLGLTRHGLVPSIVETFLRR